MKSLLEIGEQKIVSVAAQRGGRYGWCVTTKMRWRRFCIFCDAEGIVSASQISSELMKKYADICHKNLTVATAHNYISSVNTTLKLLDPLWISCSPRNLVGFPRKFVRTTALSFNASDINSAADELEKLGYLELAFLVRFSSEFGLRRREAALLDVPNALKEARQLGSIDIHRGTKGGRGRSVERWVPCCDERVILLDRSEHYLNGARCLVPPKNSLKYLYNRISNICLPVLKHNGIKKLHELRVFYACRRYSEITGCVAPCNRIAGDLIATHGLDELARKTISAELGHSRIQIVSSYIGRKVRRSGIHE